MSNAQTSPHKVCAHSLPWSLRHSSPNVALNEAHCLAVFLKGVTTSEDNGSNTAMGDWKQGLYLCFNLLIDKLDIATGDYKFPEISHDPDAPKLCERKGA